MHVLADAHRELAARRHEAYASAPLLYPEDVARAHLVDGRLQSYRVEGPDEARVAPEAADVAYLRALRAPGADGARDLLFSFVGTFDAESPLLVDESPDDVAVCVNGHVLLRGPLDDAARALLGALRAGTPVAFDALDDAGRAIVRHVFRARGADRMGGSGA